MSLLWAATSLMRWSWKYISPASMELKPAIIRRSVVLPQPEGPSSVKNSPSLIFNDTSLIAVKSPYFFVTLSILTFVLMLVYLLYFYY